MFYGNLNIGALQYRLHSHMMYIQVEGFSSWLMDCGDILLMFKKQLIEVMLKFLFFATISRRLCYGVCLFPVLFYKHANIHEIVLKWKWKLSARKVLWSKYTVQYK